MLVPQLYYADLLLHTLVYLVHTSCIEAHDGSMGQAVKDCAHSLFGIQGLCLEQLLHEPLVKHCCYNIIQHCKSKEESCSLEKIPYKRTNFQSISDQINFIHFL